ncbi:hypothetical protein [Streptococcus ovuberis]|uniref:Uncharacterized protein n=1 Tax=Streptococcus ovuberis TaxID=1936207 RepID=A0A7X6MZU6_9STRE|nr:hypothetical protein [Streptococcus ovuberis]NKZ21435.1 hypothetical protein [Streptococcus ovuberis]
MLFNDNVLRNQWLAITMVGVADIVALSAALLSDDPFLKIVLWVGFVLASLFLVGLIWGLKTAKQLAADQKLDKIRPAYDERQQAYILKSYSLGFWYMIFIFWLSIFISRFGSHLVGLDFMLALGLWGGLGLSTTYANLKGASYFVDSRFGSKGKLFGWSASFFGLFVMGMGLFTAIADPSARKVFFTRGGDGSFMVLGLALFSMGASILYRLYQNKKEEG